MICWRLGIGVQLGYYQKLMLMKTKSKEVAASPFLRNSVLYFEECCSRDIFVQTGLIYRHKYNLYQNARNRRKYTQNARKGNQFKPQITPQSAKSSPNKAAQINPSLEISRKTAILNITPAIIHTPTSTQLRSTVSLTSKSHLRQSKKQKPLRYKTKSIDWSQRRSSCSKESYTPFFSVCRPKTAHQGSSALHKIKVELPSRPWSGKLKDEGINGWQNSYQEEQP